MFGVLVVRAPDDRIGYLCAYSGMLAGAWTVPGFAPPLFDLAVRDAMWPAGQDALRSYELAIRALDRDPSTAAARAALAAHDAQVAEELAAMQARHRANRAARHAARRAHELATATATATNANAARITPPQTGAAKIAKIAKPRLGGPPAREVSANPVNAFPRGLLGDLGDLGGSPSEGDASPNSIATDTAAAATTPHRAAALHSLDQQSRADAAERKRFDARSAEERARLAARVEAIDARRAELERARADESRELMKQVHDQYVIANAKGETRALRALFAPGEPAAGAGDCAGPKLLGEAYRRGLVPLALAEVWVGAPPATGGRHAGTFYPSCRGKCGPILPFMLDGLPLAEAPSYGAAPVAEERVVYEDAWIVVVDKPVGLLSVPGRGGLRDSVQTRLRRRYPEASGPLVVHRLDLDTSGLLLAAKDADTQVVLQAQFARREIDKRYVAWLDGEVVGESGVIEIALRVDLDDRPRQLHDPVHGKHAVTEWRVVAREAGRTRVVLVPRTGRTHQLRVHAAHPRGLDAPIVGDRLYGRRDDEAPRLMLHAEGLAFVHPRTGERVELVTPAPF